MNSINLGIAVINALIVIKSKEPDFWCLVNILLAGVNVALAFW